jgi:hypothetical protein
MSTLESSITLEDLFAVVTAKRVPLAPELAGYLVLGIADGTEAGTGPVDPKTVFISEEGTVVLVRPKRDLVDGDTEASVRALLARLLEASGSATPALNTAATRRAGHGLPALVEELEAALIPVNRAAGRRALARLAREAKRVVYGIGRNASVPPPPPADIVGPASSLSTSPHELSNLALPSEDSNERDGVEEMLSSPERAPAATGPRRTDSVPPPAGAPSSSKPPVEPSRDIGLRLSRPPPGSHPALRSLSERAPAAPKTGMGLLVVLLLLGIGVTLALWWFAPSFFTGRGSVAPR